MFAGHLFCLATTRHPIYNVLAIAVLLSEVSYPSQAVMTRSLGRRSTSNNTYFS
jgi:hypothetical protein